MSKVILMATFVLLHSLWCLFNIFGHFNFQYCLHLFPYYIFIDFLKRNLKEYVQNTDHEINLSQEIIQQVEKLRKCSENADGRLTENYEDAELETPTVGQMKSGVNIQQNIDVSFSELDTASSFKKFSPFVQRNNITETSEQISALSSETTLVQGTQYIFYDDNGEKFIIDNADFEEEETELVNIFNLNSASLSNISNIELGSYNQSIHFKPIPVNVSTVNSTDENGIFSQYRFSSGRERTN
ncbi:hypothetical protein TNCV_2070441 [Trichonephila clavipes]|uniref:Uncharacterized protein n=1 Tax=Trichonephila clavipes TaxID=2585209 RepID=A0A8X7BE86_TRICX|nr:hypothetical protein TNCV_2070441 [Trichonephila clavipes]